MRFSPTPPDEDDIVIRLHQGARHTLWPLFELADDSSMAIRGYIDEGVVHVAMTGGVAIGHAQVVRREGTTHELRSLAVLPSFRRRGIGTRLVDRSVAWVRVRSGERLLVGTATADLENLRFYQQLGFRMLRVERDVFTPEQGYPEGLVAHGIPVRDRVWLLLEL